jgi:DNA-binding Lrp family transcriptional regulator
MDEMKLRLSTKWMRGLVSKLLAKVIYKKFGVKINLQINELDVSSINGNTNVKAGVEIKLNNEEFMKLMNQLNED